MSEDKAEYQAEPLGDCDVCVWHGEQTPATCTIRHERYPRSYMVDSGKEDKRGKRKRVRLVVAYNVCDEHKMLAQREMMDAAIANYEEKKRRNRPHTGQQSLIVPE